ncbi:MAG: phosphoglycerate mutase, partial [Tannerellaceae bacterium]|nr:phosphoglycerate mutase [Tannerellaceae bacterium]
WEEPVTIVVLPDHPTPCAIRTHTNTPIPFILWRPGIQPDPVTTYDEFSVLNGKYGILEKDELIKLAIQK